MFPKRFVSGKETASCTDSNNLVVWEGELVKPNTCKTTIAAYAKKFGLPTPLFDKAAAAKVENIYCYQDNDKAYTRYAGAVKCGL